MSPIRKRYVLEYRCHFLIKIHVFLLCKVSLEEFHESSQDVDHLWCKKVYLKADYVIWLISVIQKTSSWQTWDSHGFFNAFMIYIFICTTCSRFRLYYSKFIYLCYDFIYWWNDYVSLCYMCNFPLLKTLICLSFHVRKPFHWIY